MNEERDPLDLQFMQKSPGQDDRELEERLGASFGPLRLLSDRGNPLSFEQARERTRREAETYFRWEASGAPLNDITVRLSDGEELTLAKRIAADLCGLRIVKKFLPGEVLHIYKKEDRRFGEVPLYSLEVAKIEDGHFTYEKTFRNKQKLTLECWRGPAGEFDICVNYTPPAGEQAWGQTAGAVNVGSILGPVLAPVERLWNAFRNRLRGDDGTARPGSVLANAVTALALLFGSISFYENYSARRNAGGASATSAPRGDVAPAASGELASAAGAAGNNDVASADAGAPVPVTQASAKSRNAGGRGEQSPAAGQAADGQNADNDKTTDAADAGSSCNGLQAANHTNATADAAAGATARRHRAQNGKSTKGGGKVNAPPSTSVAETRIPIYVKASAPGDSKLAKQLLDAFVAALHKTKRFEVWTDSPGVSVPREVYEVSLDFERKDNCFGMIYSRFYDVSGKPMGDDAKDCHEYPKATMLATTSAQIVNEILLPLIEERKDSSRRGA